MRARDWVIALAIALLYAVLAFTNLGDTRAAQYGYTTKTPGEQITFDFGEETTLVQMQLYSYSLQPKLTSITFEISHDGDTWEPFYVRTRADKDPSYGHSAEFTWQDVNFWKTPGRYVRITVADADVTFFEAAFRDIDGNLLTPPKTTSSTGLEWVGGIPNTAQADANRTNIERAGAVGIYDLSALYDEQNLVPQAASYLNSMHFDEIYHARTSFEMLHGLPWYENTHPPLGKIIIMASISSLGMTPFAWRLPGTIAGVLMLPVLFAMAKLLFRRTWVAAFATGVFALDCMHFALTRIATVDSFEVLFLLIMFYFLLRYLFAERPLTQLHTVDLLCCGLFMGLAIATKWIGCYAAIGVAVLLFAYWIRLGIQARRARQTQQARQARETREPREARKGTMQTPMEAFAPWLGRTILVCVVGFLLIPAAIYFASFGQLYSGAASSAASAWTTFWNQQVNMFSYHSALQEGHYFASPWYEWPLDIRPIWWYDNHSNLIASTINCMGNPIIWWLGAVAMVCIATYAIVRIATSVKLREFERNLCNLRDLRIAWFIIVGYLCLYVPWMFISRATFIYHYFACTPFLALAIAFFLWRGLEMNERIRRIARISGIAFIVLATAGFLLFLPVISGIEVSPEYIKLTKWLPTWTIWQ